MSTVPIDLPDELREFIEEKVKSGKFRSASDYIVALIATARDQGSEIELALAEGLRSGPAEPLTEEDWRELRSRISHRDND